ncbi:MAG: hypothetical protein QOD73_2465 [Solirubrobacteraceae bacterium]|nr:hypothetical protein [Solirubrobacteraceae bacterium]
MQSTSQGLPARRQTRRGPGGRRPAEIRMPAKERPMAQVPQQPPSDKRREEIHRAQVTLVQASLRAGVHYQRPGRVDKSHKPPART